MEHLEGAATVEDLFDLAAPAITSVVGRLVPENPESVAVDITLEKSAIWIGRSRELPREHQINSPRLSNKHCEITLDSKNREIRIVDHSTNGTFVNGKRLEKGQPRLLDPGDRVSFHNPEGPAPAEHVYVFQRLRPTLEENSLVEELTCPVCRSIMFRPTQCIPCVHVFCAPCISAWTEKNTSCPECRGDVSELRPALKVQAVLDNFLRSRPHFQRSASELATLTTVPTIPAAGKKLRKRHRSPSLASEDDDEDAMDAFSSASSFEAPAPGGFLTMFHHTEIRDCPQCTTPSPVDGFQCPKGQIHLSCFLCKRRYPDRPLSSIPQKCEMCNVAFCDLYLGGCLNASGVGYLQKVVDHPITDLPLGALFSGNTVELNILRDYLRSKSLSPSEVWKDCLEKFQSKTWLPGLSLVKGELLPSSIVCRPCVLRIFAGLLFWYRRSLVDLPDWVKARPDCWFGIHCRTQKHNIEHSKHYNHVCEQVKRKE